MPPQQPDRLLDLFYQPFDFGAHGYLWCGLMASAAGRLFTTGRRCSGDGRKAQSPLRPTLPLSTD
jgi:hypothetical protein